LSCRDAISRYIHTKRNKKKPCGVVCFVCFFIIILLLLWPPNSFAARLRFFFFFPKKFVFKSGAISNNIKATALPPSIFDWRVVFSHKTGPCVLLAREFDSDREKNNIEACINHSFFRSHSREMRRL
jgi:predicted membrane protein